MPLMKEPKVHWPPPKPLVSRPSRDKVTAVRDNWNQTVNQMTGDESKLLERLAGWKEFMGVDGGIRRLGEKS